MRFIFKKILFFTIATFAFSSLMAQKKNSSASKNPQPQSVNPTTTKSPEAKNAVDKLKKNPGQKKNDVVVVYNEDFVKGEELFQLNKPEEAIVYFEKSLDSENVDPNVYVYLGVCYYQIEEYDKSLSTCVKGMSKEGTDKKILAYNAGNSCYAMGNYMRADASYAIALKEDENYSPAVLNRANAQLKLDHLGDARSNYIRYIELEPETPQRERIEIIIKLLEEEIERRAKESPELINPDVFVANENMEIPETPEKVINELPLVLALPLAPEELVKDEAKAPRLPEIVAQKEKEEKVTRDGERAENSEESPSVTKIAESAGEKFSKKEAPAAEKIDAPEISALPSQNIQKGNQKTGENRKSSSEKIAARELEIPDTIIIINNLTLNLLN